MVPDRVACFAITTPGIEPVMEGENRALGIDVTGVEPGGVSFSAAPRQLADALVRLRTANRVTVRIAAFRARSFVELERHVADVDWMPVLAGAGAVHFRVTAKKSRLYHQDAIAERLERAVHAVDRNVQLIRAPGDAEALERDVTTIPAVQRLVVRVFRDQVTISADASGALMHRRGWRQDVAKAPLRETLAAAAILASGWTAGEALCDPFCGSGTIAIEAALVARGIAPGRGRRFAAERWSAMAGKFKAARDAALAAERAGTAPIEASDRDAGAVEATLANAGRAGVAEMLTVRRATISELTPAAGTGWIITNPPYGVRVGERSALRNLYAAFGTVVRERRPGWRMAMLSGDRVLAGQTGFRFEDLLHTTNGGIPVRIIRST